MIKLKNVTKQYRDFTLNCTLEVKPGSITGLIGPNGAGKSTTFKAVLNLIYPDSGQIELFGMPASSLSPKDREKVGAVLSDSGFSGYLTVNDILTVMKNMYSQFQEDFFRQKCQEFNLPMNQKIKEFSTGMKAKLKVLCAISHEAELLILDEPTAGLDVIARDSLLEMLREYMESGERSILISSHISSDLEGLCDDVYLVDRGNIILHEETDTLLDSYGVLKVTPEQYGTLDKKYVLRCLEESFGYKLLTSHKEFYMENYPDFVMEKGNIDQIITMMIRGKEI